MLAVCYRTAVIFDVSDWHEFVHIRFTKQPGLGSYSAVNIFSKIHTSFIHTHKSQTCKSYIEQPTARELWPLHDEHKIHVNEHKRMLLPPPRRLWFQVWFVGLFACKHDYAKPTKPNSSDVSECPSSSSSSSKIQCTKGERQNYQKEIMIQLHRGL